MSAIKTKRMLFMLWLTTALIILFTLFLINVGYARTNDVFEDLSPRERDIAERMERKYLDRNNKVLSFKGNAEIEEDERVNGDVLVVKGTLDLRGQVDGDVMAIFGDVDVAENAYVEGDVISVNGKVWTEGGAIIRGDIVVTDVPIDDDYENDGVSIEKRDPRVEKPVKSHPRHDWPNDDDEVVYADYNRVDGFTIGLKFPQAGWWHKNRHNFALLGKAGYSFGRKQWQYKVGLERWTMSELMFGIGAELYNLTDTQDDWIIGDHENALAAGLFKKDFRDYYKREGYSFYVRQYFGRTANLKVAYQDDEFSDLKKVTNWALFGGDKSFRQNPNALPYKLYAEYGDKAALNIKSITANLTIDTRNDDAHPTRGWYIQAFAEHADKDMNNLDGFRRYILDFRRYQPLSWDENIALRLRGGTSTGLLPPMYLFDLGGISTLRGFDFKEMTGDRMVLGNLEYRLGAGNSGFLGLDIILFMDSGLAWFANENNKKYAYEYVEKQEIEPDVRPEDTFKDLTWSALKTDAGIGLATNDNTCRFNIARRIDRSGGDIYMTLRICRPF